MKFKSFMLAALLILSANFSQAGTTSLDGFDFDYSVELNKAIGLTQVFDDGDRTYFQFTQAEKLPTIYQIKSGKKIAVEGIESRAPYLIVPFLGNKFVLSINNGKTSVSVNYNGSRPAQAPASNNSPGNKLSTDSPPKSAEPVAQSKATDNQQQKISASPSKTHAISRAATEADDESKPAQGFATGTLFNIPFFENSVFLTKKSKDELQQKSDEITAATKIVVRGRPSVRGDLSIAKTRALSIKNFLVDMGVDEGLIEVTQDQNTKAGKNEGFFMSELILLSDQGKATYSSRAKQKEFWELTPSDKNLEIALNKWAAKAGYQQIVWDMPEEIPITSSAKFEGSFEQCLEKVIQSLRNTDSPIKAKYYSNKVIRITALNGAK